MGAGGGGDLDASTRQNQKRGARARPHACTTVSARSPVAI